MTSPAAPAPTTPVQEQNKPRAWLSVPTIGAGRVSQSERDAKSWINNGLRVIPLYEQPGSNADYEVGYLKERLLQTERMLRELQQADAERLTKYVEATSRVRQLEAQLRGASDRVLQLEELGPRD